MCVIDPNQEKPGLPVNRDAKQFAAECLAVMNQTAEPLIETI